MQNYNYDGELETKIDSLLMSILAYTKNEDAHYFLEKLEHSSREIAELISSISGNSLFERQILRLTKI
jgi:hypothetical protein